MSSYGRYSGYSNYRQTSSSSSSTASRARRGSPVYDDYDGAGGAHRARDGDFDRAADRDNQRRDSSREDARFREESLYNSSRASAHRTGYTPRFSDSNTHSHSHSSSRSNRNSEHSEASSRLRASPIYGENDMDSSSYTSFTSRPYLSSTPPPPSSHLRRYSPPPTNRSRSPTPAPAPPPKLTSPTPAYMHSSSLPSHSLPSPTASRKLLVLDLNGTLLLRAAHSGRRFPPPTQGTAPRLPALRTIYPRPYLGSFRKYLFREETRVWLDTMVWSSAQPHSVGDMVDKCFGEEREMLKVVWARDTLGLKGDEYYKKTQTTKDLSKPWKEIPSIIPGSSPTSASTSHSERSTLLMDDSPLKAVLQPWNHLCVPEYGADMRRRDVGIAEREAGREAERERQKARARLLSATKAQEGGKEEMEEGEEREGEDLEGENREVNEDDAVLLARSDRKRKRIEKKQLKKDKKLAASVEGGKEAGELEEGSESEKEEEKYDETLLAIIGILDRIKHEDNVAGWMRAGGLVRVLDEDLTSVSATAGNVAISQSETSADGGGGGERSTTPSARPSPSKKRRTSSSSSINPSQASHSTPTPTSSPPPLPKSSPIHTPPAPSSPSIHPSSPYPWPEQQNTGVPLSPQPPASVNSTIDAEAGGKAQEGGLWYDNPDVVAYWAQRGRTALAALGISVESEVVVPR
ncbi:hypothetical protein B0H34DRAFT_121141 [Crassisporium funariophilum]|nr:hypothetical protein B0H34DRAFT_121141 [Crassisporium funariophilum]